MHKVGFSSNFLEKAHFIVKMTGLTMVQPASLTKGKHPKFLYQRSVIIYLSIYFGHSRTDLRSLPHSCLLAMTGARSCLERLVSLSSRSMNIVAGCPLEYLPCFGSQSWETVSFLVLQQWPLNCSQHDCCHKSKNI